MIYLDHAAATPVSEKALKAMQPYFSDDFFNPSAPYLPAKRVREAYESYKADLAHVIGAKAADLVVTSGATESINLAFTVLEKAPDKKADEEPEVLILATEHAAVKETAKQYRYQEIAVDRFGIISLEDLKAKLTSSTKLVSIALANNELGAIQPMAKISTIINEERQKRLQQGNKLYLHSDASQALSLLDINLKRLGIDLLTLNAAKVYGPKGIGALYVSRGIKLQPISRGGGQELGLRSGTENVPALAGFAAAATDAKTHLAQNRKHYQNLTTILKTELQKAKIEPLFLGNPKHQLANFCPVSFPGLDAERLIYLLEDEGVYLSTGAACAASKNQKSETLQAIGLTEEEIKGSLRISLGALNNEENIKQAGRKIVQAVSSELARLKEANA